MPILVPCEELQTGMCLFEPIISNGRIMMQSGRPLTASDIASLQRRYPGLSVRVGDPVLDNVIDFEDDAVARDVAMTVQKRVSESMSQVHDRFAERASLSNADFNALNGAVKELMEFLRNNPASAALVVSSLDKKTYLSSHTGNVFYLSMLLGASVIDYITTERNRQTSAGNLTTTFAMDLTSLGLGALVMDLGMLPLQNLFALERPLTEEEQAQIHGHARAGADMLPENFSSTARMIVRTHHENYDGSGYPDKLAGEKLHVFTRIIRIADAYDAATSDRVYKSAKSPARVLWEMLIGPYKRFYDPKLMAAFARMIQPFPIGSKLLLEDGRYAVVVRYNRQNPFFPVVIIAFDSYNRPIPQSKLHKPVALSADSDLKIRSFRGEDLSFIYDDECALEARVTEKFTNLLQSAYP